MSQGQVPRAGGRPSLLALTTHLLGYGAALMLMGMGLALALRWSGLCLPVADPGSQVLGVCIALYGLLRFCQRLFPRSPVSDRRGNSPEQGEGT